MIRKTIALGLGVTALTPLAAYAQQSLLLDEITATASLVPIEINRTGTTVETLDATDIAQGGLSIGQTLALLPGVSITTNGGLGATSTLRLRGLGGSYIGVRIDGIDMTDPSSTQTAFNFGTLTAGLPDRIELLKGSQSALYGSNAIAGVVDITTWRPDAPGFSGRANVEAGSFGTAAATLNLGQKGARGEMALTFSRLTTDGFSARSSDDEKDGFDQTQLILSAAYDATEDLRLGFSALYSDGTSEFDRSTADPSGEIDQTRRGLRSFAEFATGAIEHELALSWVETERFDAGGFTKHFVGERTRLDYLGRVDLSADLTLAFGADWTEEKATLDGVRYDADSAAAFGELQYAVSPALDLALSLRHDSYSDFDDQLSGRAALAWRMRDDVILRAVVGTGYRAPSLYERFGPFGSATLEPEKSRSAEIGIEKRYGTDSFAKATVFHTEIDDLIDYDFGTSAYNQVPGTTTSKGIELSGRHAVSDRVALFGAYTYTDATNPDGRMVRVPRHDLSLGVEAGLTDRLDAQIGIQAVADRTDTNDWPNPPSNIADYTLVNLGLSYAVTDSAQAYLRVENLFDESYEPVRGYNGAGRSVFVGLRASF
ncbi:TonB-dependent receptor [Rhodovulum tesquicola]|uniref:TonB-dependent receptor plug domain-containing protein n=1 Tax=Rhodovulum tesquicola TaxID=540254 RepID=UPI002096F81C|nr:TonB-dependent receptor [Rhodovulum tesquicola]MCO8146279.1 TonB-dependent receptor [Rhodovulum tesquicola]